MDDIEKSLANRQGRLRWTARVLLFGACVMTVGFYSSGRSLLAVSDDRQVLTSYRILDAIVMGAGTAVFWCLYIQCDHAARLTRLVSQVFEKLKHLRVDSEMCGSEEGIPEGIPGTRTDIDTLGKFR